MLFISLLNDIPKNEWKKKIKPVNNVIVVRIMLCMYIAQNMFTMQCN